MGLCSRAKTEMPSVFGMIEKGKKKNYAVRESMVNCVALWFGLCLSKFVLCFQLSVPRKRTRSGSTEDDEEN